MEDFVKLDDENENTQIVEDIPPPTRVVEKEKFTPEQEWELLIKNKGPDFKLLKGRAMSGELKYSKLRYVYWMVKKIEFFIFLEKIYIIKFSYC